MHFLVPSDRKLIRGIFDEEQDLRQPKNLFFISQIRCYYGGTAPSGSTTEPDHIPTLEERVDILTNQVVLLISHFRESDNKSVEMASPNEEVEGFLSPREERERDEAEKGKARLPKFAPPQPFDGTMKETKSFISSLILYIYIWKEGRVP